MATTTDDPLATLATHALGFVRDGDVVGLGSGRAASAFVRALAARVRDGLRVRGVPTSEETARMARELGIDLVGLEAEIALTVDGADEVDGKLNLIKGYGGALVRERIVAAASFHGARLATDAPESPHLLAPRMKARVYVAGAVEDASFTDEAKKRLDDALTEAGVDHTVVTYEGARHGWVPTDTPVHNPAAAERHYEALFALFDATLRSS